MKIRAISLWQPWATLVVHGLKQYETRSWATNHSGPLLIHAAKHLDKAILTLCQTNAYIKQALEALTLDYASLPRGGFVGAVNIVNCQRVDNFEADMRKNASDKKLTQELINTITAYIRSGAFPHVAAEASGVTIEEFERWMERGTTKSRKGIFKALAVAVKTATAQARIMAEIQVKENDPLAWLTRGPGKETVAKAGWTTATKPTVRENNQQINLLLDPGMQGIFGSLLQVLAPFPEARAKVAEALAGDLNGKTPQLPLLPPPSEN